MVLTDLLGRERLPCGSGERAVSSTCFMDPHAWWPSSGRALRGAEAGPERAYEVPVSQLHRREVTVGARDASVAAAGLGACRCKRARIPVGRHDGGPEDSLPYRSCGRGREARERASPRMDQAFFAARSSDRALATIHRPECISTGTRQQRRATGDARSSFVQVVVGEAVRAESLRSSSSRRSFLPPRSRSAAAPPSGGPWRASPRPGRDGQTGHEPHHLVREELSYGLWGFGLRIQGEVCG